MTSTEGQKRRPVRPVRNRSELKNRSAQPRRAKNSASGNSTVSVMPAKPIPPKPEVLIEPEVQPGKVRFCDLDLHADIRYGIQAANFSYCTPIQAEALPILLSGRDMAGKAQTGTGKTAAFLLAAFNHMLNHPLENQETGVCRALVLAPTRELAIQIGKDADLLGAFTGLRTVVVFGGMDHEKQRKLLDGKIDILVGTPGRLIDFARSRSVNLSKTEILIIDEADRMLDMGFIPDVRRIIAQLPPREKRQTMFFSATLDDSILRLAHTWLRESTMVESEPESMVGENIEQIFYTASISEKLPLLLYFIRTMQFDRMLIFGNRKDTNLSLQHQLARYGVKTALLSGDIPQEKRLRILEDFRSGKERIVIATDVAARGIHVDNVSVVINYDLPEHPEDYIHRIGRTGRAGHTGKAISLVCEYGAYMLPEIEKYEEKQFHCIFPEDEMLVLPPEVTPPNQTADKNAYHPRRKKHKKY